MNAPTLSRRQFAKGAGALVIGFALAPETALSQAADLPGSLKNNRMLDGWLRINPDGSATIFAGKVELGQGILTALAQIAAEELDLPLARIAMISGDTAQTPDEGHTSGSQSLEFGRPLQPPILAAGLDVAAGQTPKPVALVQGALQAKRQLQFRPLQVEAQFLVLDVALTIGGQRAEGGE